MKNTKSLLIMLLVVVLIGCKSSKPPTTGVWVNKEKIQGKSFHKIFIVAMTADVEVRSRLETDLAAAAVKKGYEAVKSSDVLPMDIKNPRKPTKEEIISKVRESGCDAVFVASVLKKEESLDYTQGGTTYSQSPEYTMEQ